MNRSQKAAYILVTVVVSSLLMAFVDSVIQPHYAVKSALKVLLFLLVPASYFWRCRDEFPAMRRLFLPRRKDLVSSVLLGFGVFGVILTAYFLLRGFIDFSGIVSRLVSGAGVSADNFVSVALYISFVNSLLEEFFFRGYAFILLREQTSRRAAYVFSSLLFALYHMGMTTGWFHPAILMLALAGLFAGGCIFDFLNERCGSIYPSWLVHMFANFAINTVGFIIFGLLP